MIKTKVTTRDFLGRHPTKDDRSFVTTEGRQECPKCGIVIHVFIPQLELQRELPAP